MNKFEKAMNLLNEHSIDAWLITCSEGSDIHSPYLLNVRSHARHFILVDAKGKHKVLAVQMEAPMIRKQIEKENLPVSVYSYSSSKEMVQKLQDILKGNKIAVNFGEDSLLTPSSFADYIRVGELQSLKKVAPKIDFVSAAPIIKGMRISKTPEELKGARNAVKVTLEILDDLPNHVKKGMTEKEIEAFIEHEYLKVGELAFDTIVAFQENSADPHHNSSKKKIEKGVLLVDTGVRIEQICSDITWTYYIGGNPPEKFLNAYNVIHEAKKAANTLFKAGSQIRAPAIKCREYMRERNYDDEKLFIHSLGHPVGFEVHDIGAVVSAKTPENYTFAKDSIYTNEPGLYWQGEFGIRIEDNLILKNDGAEIISWHPKDPIII
ncbi:MAG: M24 family metallopeptidase [Promethearchaeota archaeon]